MGDAQNNKRVRTRRMIAEARRVQVARLTIQGYTQSELAERFGCSQQLISHDLKAIDEEWKRRYAGTIHANKMRQLAELDLVAVEAWTEWERSKQVARSSGTMRETESGEGGKTKTKRFVKKKERVGEPEFLRVIRDVTRDRSQLLGLVTDPGMSTREPISVVNIGFEPEALASALGIVAGAAIRTIEAIPVDGREDPSANDNGDTRVHTNGDSQKP